MSSKRLGAIGLSALVGAVEGVLFVAFVAFLFFIAVVWWSGWGNDQNRWFIAAFVIFFAAPAAVVVGLIGCILGAWRVAQWRPLVEPGPDDTWTAPNAEEVQRVIAGQEVELEPIRPDSSGPRPL